jgi:hypothetical protein
MDNSSRVFRLSGLLGVAAAEILILNMQTSGGVPLLFAPFPLFVFATVLLGAHRISWDAAALGLATLVFALAVSVFDGKKENPAALVAAVAGMAFAILDSAFAAASGLVGWLLARGFHYLRLSRG